MSTCRSECTLPRPTKSTIRQPITICLRVPRSNGLMYMIHELRITSIHRVSSPKEVRILSDTSSIHRLLQCTSQGLSSGQAICMFLQEYAAVHVTMQDSPGAHTMELSHAEVSSQIWTSAAERWRVMETIHMVRNEDRSKERQRIVFSMRYLLCFWRFAVGNVADVDWSCVPCPYAGELDLCPITALGMVSLEWIIAFK